MDGDHQRDKPSPAELRRSERILRADQIAPRGLTKASAAAYCGCSKDAFNTWVKKGLVPEAIPGTQRWDRKAIDWYLDRASGLPTGEAASSDPLAEWLVSERKAGR
ncbi:hypothetical protein GA0061099_102021 [Bradyrhizobium yuanmingense]|uniref:Helix-turn-helix domain-containing protein n=1 Tax=Bradyrhizobium yuanmingense TaxID=108015 RepID=A0A1C3XH80_9BRAD|nr:hypothetical protein EHH60_36220 [Bradyrhizobium sp. RP6]TWI18304.1 hypothetical protein IQ15_07193 [Bradyrhizobium yuanmingense]SCB51613.1 hypothetical protein GA0061099_102021 [Bradyrhizobium yuanmingense]